MDIARYELIKLEHGHGGGKWHPMEEVGDPARSDVEREWAHHKLFRCTTCEDEIRVQVPDAGRGR